MTRAGRPKGHKPANVGKPNWFSREPPRSSVAIVRDLFDKIDDTGLSLSAFGERCGYSIVSLSQWRHGRSRPTISAITDMANALGYQLALVERPCVSTVDFVDRHDGQKSTNGAL